MSEAFQYRVSQHDRMLRSLAERFLGIRTVLLFFTKPQSATEVYCHVDDLCCSSVLYR